jgi:hypothetical protein
MTNALIGGFKYKPIIFADFSVNSGSVLTH